MRIKTIVEAPDGAYEFTAVLNAMQHQFLLEYAIRDLIARGLMPLPVAHDNATDIATVMPIAPTPEQAQ